MTILRDISILWSFVHVLILFIFLYEIELLQVLVKVCLLLKRLKRVVVCIPKIMHLSIIERFMHYQQKSEIFIAKAVIR